MIGQKGLGIMKLDKQTDEQARMKVNCANVSSALTQKVKGLEGEVFGEAAEYRLAPALVKVLGPHKGVGRF